jgi:hypothetical protein
MNRPLYFFVALMAGTVSVSAQEAQFTSASPAQLTKMNGKRTPAAKTGSGVNLSINLVYDDSDYQAKTFYIYNEDTFLGDYVTVFDPEAHTIVFDNIEPGTYTIMAAFDELYSHPGNPWTKCYVFLEDVEVKETMAVDVVAASAKNQFIGKSFLPDGEEARVDNNGYDENLDPLFVPGNCLSKLIQTTIYDTRYDAWIVSAVGNTGSYAMDNIYGPGLHWRPEEMYNIMVNDISDRFLVCQQRDNYVEEGIVATVAYSRGTENLQLQNDIENFRSVEEFFNHTPAFDTYGSSDDRYQYSCLGYKEWGYIPYTMLPWNMSTPFAMFYSASANEEEFTDFHPYYRFQLYDAMVDWNEFNIKGQRFTFDRDGAIYSFSNFFSPSEVSGVMALDDAGEEVYYEFPGNPGLEVKGSPFLNYAYGNSASLNTITPLVYKYDGKFVTNLNPNFKGLLGEEREADKIDIEVSVTHNGEEVLSDGALWNSFWNEAPEADPSGVYTARIENNRNILVDETEGYNITTLSFSYEREDICPPAIQAIQFRNAGNEFAQRFESAEDVNIIVCAGDYTWNENEDYLLYNYASLPVDLTVAVAAHDAEEKEWTAVPMANVAEYDNLAGYGYFFRGALKDILADAKPGWYDVRITATDKAGNSNEQILGPAFQLTGLTGVENVDAEKTGLVFDNGVISVYDGEINEFRVYSSDGRLRLHRSGSRISLDNLERGIYMVTATNGNRILRGKFVK